MRLGKRYGILTAICSLLCAGAAEKTISTGPGNDSLIFEIQRAIDKGLASLEKVQNPEGWWSTADHPALTALALVALQGDPAQKDRPRALTKGYDFLLTCAHEDGIYGKRELINYNTSVALMALAAAKDSKYDDYMRRARRVLIKLQYDAGEKGVADDLFDGGVGYGGSSPKPDMVNTLHALEALYYSRKAAPDTGASEPDLNWEAAIKFIQNCQHLSKYNKQQWVSEDIQNKGGFVYSPESSKAGEVEVEGGRKALRAYGSISYAGMLSYVYAGLKPEDPRVKAVVEWAKHNYSLQENPGMGAQGLYFYFYTMTKALSAAQVDVLETADGKRHNWREELTLRLLDLQKPDGSWANDNGRWWEKDPVLTTAYSVIALERLYRSM